MLTDPTFYIGSSSPEPFVDNLPCRTDLPKSKRVAVETWRIVESIPIAASDVHRPMLVVLLNRSNALRSGTGNESEDLIAIRAR